MVTRIRSRKTLAALVLAALIPTAGLAQTPAPAAATPPEPDWTFTGNVGLFSQYVFRGISQTNEKPAVQGGFDLGHKSGFYVGTWASNISWVSDGYFSPPNPPPAPSASLEWDFYGGYKGSLPWDFGYDLGVLYYWYPGTYPAGFTNPDTTELYAALSWKWLSFKYSWERQQSFGLPDSRGSQVPRPHGFLQHDRQGQRSRSARSRSSAISGRSSTFSSPFINNSFFDYSDWKVGASAEILRADGRHLRHRDECRGCRAYTTSTARTSPRNQSSATSRRHSNAAGTSHVTQGRTP